MQSAGGRRKRSDNKPAWDAAAEDGDQQKADVPNGLGMETWTISSEPRPACSAIIATPMMTTAPRIGQWVPRRRPATTSRDDEDEVYDVAANLNHNRPE
jgi:hypothetical protein